MSEQNTVRQSPSVADVAAYVVKHGGTLRDAYEALSNPPGLANNNR